MPKFTRRVGGADLMTNPYYNDSKYCGVIPYTSNTIKQCAWWCICRTGEIAEELVTYYNNISTKDQCRKPIFKRSGYGNAKEWWNDTLWEKTTRHDEARLGDIIVYGKGWGGGYGHVRIIEFIDENYFYCSGGNEDGKGTIKYNIKVARKNGNGDTDLIGFIHNPFLDENNDPTESKEEVDYKTLYEKEKSKLDRIKAILEEE